MFSEAKKQCWLTTTVFIFSALFFIGLNAPFRMSRYAFMLLILAGIYKILSVREFDSIDFKYFIFALIIPFAYLLNMAVLGWGGGDLDRPLRLILAFPIFYLLRRTNFSISHLLIILATSAAIMCTVGIYHVYIEGMERGFSGLMKTGPYGNYAAVFFAMGFFVIGSKSEVPSARNELIAAFLLLIFSTGAMIASGTRSAWAGALVMTAMSLLYFLKKNGIKFLLNRFTLLSIASVVLAISFGGNFVTDRLGTAAHEFSSIIKSPNSIATHETSIGQRIVSWRLGIDLFLDHPVWGVGLANFQGAVSDAVKLEGLPMDLISYGGLHNFVIDHLAKTGIMGTLLIFLFWLYAFRIFYLGKNELNERTKHTAFLGTLLLTGEITFSFFGSMFASSIGSYVFVVLFVMLAAIVNKNTRPTTPPI